MRVLKEKRMYSTALLCFKKGNKIIQELLKKNNHNDKELEIKLMISKARYYHYASAVFFELNKYLKAISYSTQAINSCKGILDNSSIEMMRFKEVLASSYQAMEQMDDALIYYEPIYYGLNVQIKSMQQQQIKQKKDKSVTVSHYGSGGVLLNEVAMNNNDNDKKEEKKENDETNYSLAEMNVWKGDIIYNIAMIYNSKQEFKKAAKYAKECSVIRNLFESKTSKQILALMLVSVIVSCPQIAEYKLALDSLEKAKRIISDDKDKKSEIKQYLPKILKLLKTVLTATVRWSKVTNTDLDHYLQTGQRKKTKNKNSKLSTVKE